jgi:hypothetical protein
MFRVRLIPEATPVVVLGDLRVRRQTGRRLAKTGGWPENHRLDARLPNHSSR